LAVPSWCLPRRTFSSGEWSAECVISDSIDCAFYSFLHGLDTSLTSHPRDTRNTKTPAYSHTATHSDDITHLSLLPPTGSWAAPSTSAPLPLPERLLLSTSTDGLVALSDLRETDEEEAVLAAENWGQSVAGAGWFGHKGAMKVWARSDMDGVATWDIGRGTEDQLEVGQILASRLGRPTPDTSDMCQTAARRRGGLVEVVRADLDSSETSRNSPLKNSSSKSSSSLRRVRQRSVPRQRSMQQRNST
jgi:hypothetical protein